MPRLNIGCGERAAPWAAQMTIKTWQELDARMRARECFAPLRLLPGAWIILRVDGHGFHRFTEGRFDRPFDERFRDLMVATALALVNAFQGVYAYTVSDEISILLPPRWDQFSRRLEKAVSLAAGLASATFTKACGDAAHFDARAWLGTADAEVLDYFRWRQSDALRNTLSAWCYWTLRKRGASAAEAASVLNRCASGAQRRLLQQNGIDFDQLPAWQRHGVGFYWESYEKRGRDPVANREVTATRRRIHTELDLPAGAAYADLLRGAINEAKGC
jgi:tRNA(His) guanylyltransferase